LWFHYVVMISPLLTEFSPYKATLLFCCKTILSLNNGDNITLAEGVLNDINQSKTKPKRARFITILILFAFELCIIWDLI